MLLKILSLLLDVVAGLLGGACLLRLYMQYQRIPFGNPVGRFVFAVTDWLVLPLRKILPAIWRVDTASLVGAYLIKLSQFLILWVAGGRYEGIELLPLLALFGVAFLAIWLLIGLMMVYTILSWVQVESMAVDMCGRLCAPLLRPLRKVIPLVGGVDLSPMALVVLLYIAAIVLGEVEAVLLRLLS